MQARVFLNWVPSISEDVVNVNVSVLANDSEILNVNVTPDVDTVEVGVFSEGDRLQATVTVSDGTHLTPAETTFTVPDLTAPQPVEGLGFTFEVVEEV